MTVQRVESEKRSLFGDGLKFNGIILSVKWTNMPNSLYFFP